jgi:hypothetical protein
MLPGERDVRSTDPATDPDADADADAHPDPDPDPDPDADPGPGLPVPEAAGVRGRSRVPARPVAGAAGDRVPADGDPWDRLLGRAPTRETATPSGSPGL